MGQGGNSHFLEGAVPCTENISSIHLDSLPEMIYAALEKQGILSQWVLETYRTKKAYDIATQRLRNFIVGEYIRHFSPKSFLPL